MKAIEIPKWTKFCIITHSVTKSGCVNTLSCFDGLNREITIDIGRQGTQVAEYLYHNANYVFFTYRDKTHDEKNAKFAEINGKNNVHYVEPKSFKI